MKKCPICWENIRKKYHYKTDTCGHVFHDFCLFKWLKLKDPDSEKHIAEKFVVGSCPICRQKVLFNITRRYHRLLTSGRKHPSSSKCMSLARMFRCVSIHIS